MEVVPGLYRHWKGGVYHVLGLVKNADNPADVQVLYRADVDGTYWRRDVSEFLGNVGDVPRFQKLEDVDGLLTDERLDEYAAKLIKMFPQMTGQLQLRKAVPEGHYYEFVDVESKNVFSIDGLYGIKQGFLSFAQDWLSGKLDRNIIKDFTDVEGYDQLVLDIVIQYIIYGKVLNG